MVAPKFLNRDELASEQKEEEEKIRAEQESRLEEEMENTFGAVERTQEMFDVVFELMEIRL